MNEESVLKLSRLKERDALVNAWGVAKQWVTLSNIVSFKYSPLDESSGYWKPSRHNKCIVN